MYPEISASTIVPTYFPGVRVSVITPPVRHAGYSRPSASGHGGDPLPQASRQWDGSRPTVRYAVVGKILPSIHHVVAPITIPRIRGTPTSRGVEFHSKSAGVPSQVQHRSQVGSPSMSLQRPTMVAGKTSPPKATDPTTLTATHDRCIAQTYALWTDTRIGSCDGRNRVSLAGRLHQR